MMASVRFAGAISFNMRGHPADRDGLDQVANARPPPWLIDLGCGLGMVSLRHAQNADLIVQ